MQAKALFTALAILAVAGCAAPEASTERDRGEVVTGSNIPRKAGAGRDRVETVTSESITRGATGAVANMPPAR